MKNLSYLLFFIVSAVFAQDIDLNRGETKQKNYLSTFDFEFETEKIIVPVEIEGVTYKFILDTGAPNIISKEINDLISPKLLKSIPITDASGIKETLDVVSVNKLKLGHIVFENTATLVFDKSKNPLFECFGVDGFIGSNMLRNSIVQIDAEHKKIRITDNRKKLNLDKKNSSKIKIYGSQSSPYLWVKLKGEKKGKEQILIDTGANGLYDISKRNYESFFEESIFNTLGESEGASAISLFGDVPVKKHYRLHLPILEINNVAFKNVITTTTNDRNSRMGSEILKYGVVTIDFINKRFYFNSKSDSINVEVPEYNFNKTLKNDTLIIGFVWDKALKQKLHYGDEILEINGNKVVICDLINKKSNLDLGDNVTLKIKPIEGEVFEITVNKQLLTKNTLLNTRE
ncbi:aspartyl protease family protein [uncultured Formosa sp.]|uniref:retropepsin-like aspartic protease n=1 Tax=uncultured Formosa sp. TaxID=255435 RepID=UPI00263098FA|nr:aspartyl protease family protein [uncultured Formosa sp.]